MGVTGCSQNTWRWSPFSTYGCGVTERPCHAAMCAALWTAASCQVGRWLSQYLLNDQVWATDVGSQGLVYWISRLQTADRQERHWRCCRPVAGNIVGCVCCLLYGRGLQSNALYRSDDNARDHYGFSVCGCSARIQNFSTFCLPGLYAGKTGDTACTR